MVTRKRGFSFEAGDDYEALPVNSTPRRASVLGIDIHSPRGNSGEQLGVERIEKKTDRTKPSLTPTLRHTNGGIHKLERGFSSQSNSIVKAARDNGTAEAAAKAAVRALAGNETKTS
jgi:hypothetical protein